MEGLYEEGKVESKVTEIQAEQYLGWGKKFQLEGRNLSQHIQLKIYGWPCLQTQRRLWPKFALGCSV